MSEEFEQAMKESFLDWLDGAGGEDIPFDMWAVDPSDYRDLQSYVPSLVVASAGGMCPFQAEGLLFNLNFYYRERHGYASLTLAPTQSDCYDVSASLYTAGMEVEEFRDGSFWVETLFTLIPKLERSKFRYSFPHKRVKFTDEHDVWSAYIDLEDDFSTHRSGWGMTPEEGWEAATKFEVDSYLEEHGWSPAQQRFHHDLILATMLPEPLEVDDREWPEPEPKFEVKFPG